MSSLSMPPTIMPSPSPARPAAPGAPPKLKCGPWMVSGLGAEVEPERQAEDLSFPLPPSRPPGPPAQRRLIMEFVTIYF